MRTTLNVDDDVLIAVREQARRAGRSVGSVLSELARAALTAAGDPAGNNDADDDADDDGLLGFAPLPRRGPLVSNALIDKLRDELGA